MPLRRFSAALPVVFLWLTAVAEADITLDPATKTATVTDAQHTISLHLRLDDRCLIDSLSILGRQVIVPQTGGCTAVKVRDAWYTTREQIASPQAKRDGSSLIITEIHYGPTDFPVSEEWHFTAADDHVDWKITRSYHASGPLQDTYFPG